MSSKRSFVQFLVGLLAPFVLVFGGAGLTVWGWKADWSWLLWTGAITVGAGLLWGAVLLLFHGPLD